MATIMSAPSSPTALPDIRQELEIMPTHSGADGRPRWLLYDPVRNAFHHLGERAVALLSVWQAAPPETLIQNLYRSHPDLDVTGDDLQEMTAFLYHNNLTLTPPENDPEIFARQEAAMRIPLHEMVVHKYLFFRIPIFKPQNFLRKYAPLTRIFFQKTTWWIIAAMGLIGLYFAGRQWDVFITTFWHFFSLQGLFFYGLSLIIIKSLHELGHAFTAHHFGTRVPIIGVAFLVMFPILYTDTTDAHRLQKRREKLLIDGGGIIAELAIAALSVFLWSFLPDGPARSAAFFAATTSWVMSLFVNLNPCMRFDGYYLISDFFGLQNLQKRGFEMGRWVMRETLFKWNDPPPFETRPIQRIGLCLYAYTTWVYRFFLFIGIAILVHHLFPKAIGIVLFSIEILFFIIRPIAAELKIWGSRIMDSLSTRRGRLSYLGVALILGLLFWPWQTRLRAPALIRPVQQTEIFPVHAAHIQSIDIREGQSVKTGQILFRLTAAPLIHERDQSIRRTRVLEAQLARRAASLHDRRIGASLDSDIERQRAETTGLNALIDEMLIRAPHDGIVSDLSPFLHKGRHIPNTQRLLRLINPKGAELIALPKEDDARRIKTGAAFRFIPDDIHYKTIDGQLSDLAPTSAAIITERLLTSQYGGPLAVRPDTNDALIPNHPVFKVKGIANEATSIREIRGIVHIQAEAASPAQNIYHSVLRVLIRETDF